MILAITGRIEAFDQTNKCFCNTSYIEAFEKAGFTCIVLSSYKNLEEIAAFCDALCITGGYDAMPVLNNSTSCIQSTYYNNSTDFIDWYAIDTFVKMNKPIIGICRGIQMINLYFKGSLYNHKEKHSKLDKHSVIFQKDTLFNQLNFEDTIVNSYHHQSIDKLGNGLNIAAKSEDGIIEAIINVDKKIIAVQWHPELMKYDPIIPFFYFWCNFPSLLHKTSEAQDIQ